MGYVKCAGYVWDMCGVRYANNLLKNPATKRLSGTKGAWWFGASCGLGFFDRGTLPETNSSHLKTGLPKRKLVFKPSIFRCFVSFREGTIK